MSAYKDDDITVEPTAAPHRNRPLIRALLRNRAAPRQTAEQHGLDARVRVGAAGGLGTPQAVAGAFAMGAA